MSLFYDPQDDVGDVFVQLLIEIYIALVRDVTHCSAEPDNSVLLLISTLHLELNLWKSFSKLLNIHKLPWSSQKDPNQGFMLSPSSNHDY